MATLFLRRTTSWTLPGWARRALEGLVSAIKPRWSDYDPPIDTVVISRIERDLGRFPPLARTIVLAALWALEWAPWLFAAGLRPTSRLPLDVRTRRLQTMSECRFGGLRGAFVVWRTHIILLCYDTEPVQRFLGMDVAAWRGSRRTFRGDLLAAHAPNDPRSPAAPSPLDGHRSHHGSDLRGEVER